MLHIYSTLNDCSVCTTCTARRAFQVICVLSLITIIPWFGWLVDYDIINRRNFLWKSSSKASLSSSLFSPSRSTIDLRYHVFINPCLTSLGPHQWRIVTSRKTRRTKKVAEFRNFLGYDFIFEQFHIVVNRRYKRSNESYTIANTNGTIRWTNGTYMVIANTHANNFHILNDLLLPVFRLSQKTEVTGLLIPEGCVDCWQRRLPIQDIGLNMMNLTVIYPMEDLISNATPEMCFDRLIMQQSSRTEEYPYFMRNGRFSEYWPPNLFTGFRDSMHHYVQSFEQSSEMEDRNNTIDITEEKTDDLNRKQTTSGVNLDANEANRTLTKPVMSWMWRGQPNNCLGRCITNELDVISYFSKYFHVNILDFSRNLSTVQALDYIHQTDVLIGLHGAGLAYTAFLRDHAMLVELRGEYSTRMFLNMASTMNIPYYAVSLQGCVGPGTNDVYNLSSVVLHDMVEEIYSAYVHEKKKKELDDISGNDMVDGQCEFPHPVEPCGHLSSTDHSRCYLHVVFKGEWHQCSWHDSCR
jgi:Glycosyltransferase 61